MRIYFFHHGKAQEAQRDRERVLSKAGVSQAMARRKKLGSKTFDLVISSPARRAMETAAIIADVEMSQLSLISELYPDPTDGVLIGEWSTAWARCKAAIQIQVGKIDSTVIFGHAECLQALGVEACRDDMDSIRKIARMNVGECEGFVLTFGDDRCVTSVELICD